MNFMKINKNVVFMIVTIIVSLFLVACASKPAPKKINPRDNFKVIGIVKSITKGINGYSAHVEATDGFTYKIVVNSIDLGDNAPKYRQFQVGEHIEVVGEIWNMDKIKQVTVRDIIQ